MPDPAEPTPPPEPAPPAAVPKPGFFRRKHNWHRIRVYCFSILLIVAMWVGGTVVTIRVHPKRMVNRALAMLPFPSTTGRVLWLNRRTLEIDDVKVGGFFYADAIVITASPLGLWRNHLAKLQILGGQLFTKPLYAALDQAGPGSGGGLDWTIGRLELSRGTIMLDNIVEETSIPIRLGVRHPIVINGLRLGAPDSSPEMTAERVTEIVNVAIVSPVDPTSPVFFFPLTRLHYTYTEIWHHKIHEVEMIRPTIYLGEDLFWLTKEIRAAHATPTTPANADLTAPWQVGHFEIQYGQLAVNAFGQPVVNLPFYYGTSVENIRLDQLNQISAKATVPIYRLDQDYQDYKVRIVNLRGNLFFSWPPKDKSANNVVNTIDIDEVSWNSIPVKDVSTTVTFDPNGVYGKLYGKCEGGDLSGNFEFYYTKGFTWNADMFCDKINCQPIAEKMVGKYVKMTGELDGEIGVQGKVTEITKCSGLLTLPNPGQLQINSMDDLLNRLPTDWIALKRDAAKIAINAFRDYPYTSGSLKLDYQPSGGTSTLLLQGPLGTRQFDVALHPLTTSDNAEKAKGKTPATP
jgi:hypothetical protein